MNINIENFFNKFNSNSNNLLERIVDDLKQVINYTKANVLDQKENINEITLEEGVEKEKDKDSFLCSQNSNQKEKVQKKEKKEIEMNH